MKTKRKPQKLGKLTLTARGFELIEFRDLNNMECSLQESSTANTDAIWLGVDDVKPQVLASQAASLGVETNETEGWVPYPIPESVLLSGRMHLDKKQAKALIRHLQNWIDSGSIKG